MTLRLPLDGAHPSSVQAGYDTLDLKRDAKELDLANRVIPADDWQPKSIRPSFGRRAKGRDGVNASWKFLMDGLFPYIDEIGGEG